MCFQTLKTKCPVHNCPHSHTHKPTIATITWETIDYCHVSID